MLKLIEAGKMLINKKQHLIGSDKNPIWKHVASRSPLYRGERTAAPNREVRVERLRVGYRAETNTSTECRCSYLFCVVLCFVGQHRSGQALCTASEMAQVQSTRNR